MDKRFYYELGLDLHKNYSQVAAVNAKGITGLKFPTSQKP